jgi:hypothetical protein
MLIVCGVVGNLRRGDLTGSSMFHIFSILSAVTIFVEAAPCIYVSSPGLDHIALLAPHENPLCEGIVGSHDKENWDNQSNNI